MLVPSLGRTLAVRIVAIAGSLLLFFVTLELGLRAASTFVGPRKFELPSHADAHVILAVGDSNVYGWGCSSDEAYPGQLQAYLEHQSPSDFHVINLGLPGMNSTEVSHRLEGWLESYRPATVILTVGINNGWIRGLGGRTDAVPSGLSKLRLRRLLRLLRLTWKSPDVMPRDTGRPELERIARNNGWIVEQRDAASDQVLLRHQGNPLKTKPYSAESALRVLWRDLEVIHKKTSRLGVRLVILTYAGFGLPHQASDLDKDTTLTNAELRRFAGQYNVALVDVRERFLRLLTPGVSRSEFFLTNTESHPNPRGYEEIVAQIVEDLEFVP